MPDVAGINVSRETIAKLIGFGELTEKWTKRINLIAPSTIPTLWERHIVDSAQLFLHAPTSFKHWVDLGSGGGFPGLVIAIISQEKQEQAQFTLVESDQRKATFLRTAVRELGLTATVISERIEVATPQECDVVSARALSPLNELLPLIKRHLCVDGTAIVPKGRNYQSEILEAQNKWRFELTSAASITDHDARVLILKDISCE